MLISNPDIRIIKVNQQFEFSNVSVLEVKLMADFFGFEKLIKTSVIQEMNDFELLYVFVWKNTRYGSYDWTMAHNSKVDSGDLWPMKNGYGDTIIRFYPSENHVHDFSTVTVSDSMNSSFKPPVMAFYQNYQTTKNLMGLGEQFSVSKSAFEEFFNLWKLTYVSS